jgi:hypothetical protein
MMTANPLVDTDAESRDADAGPGGRQLVGHRAGEACA